MDTKREGKVQTNRESLSSVSFEGIPSGDHESFCWDVTEETYVRITGRQPEEYDQAVFHKGMFRLYPNDLLPEFKVQDTGPLKFSVQVEPVSNQSDEQLKDLAGPSSNNL